MFDIHCHVCDRRYLVGSRSIQSFHNTSEGPVAYVRCPHGHHLVRSFGGARPATQPVIEQPGDQPGVEQPVIDRPGVEQPAA